MVSMGCRVSTQRGHVCPRQSPLRGAYHHEVDSRGYYLRRCGGDGPCGLIEPQAQAV